MSLSPEVLIALLGGGSLLGVALTAWSRRAVTRAEARKIEAEARIAEASAAEKETSRQISLSDTALEIARATRDLNSDLVARVSLLEKKIDDIKREHRAALASRDSRIAELLRENESLKVRSDRQQAEINALREEASELRERLALVESHTGPHDDPHAGDTGASPAPAAG